VSRGRNLPGVKVCMNHPVYTSIYMYKPLITCITTIGNTYTYILISHVIPLVYIQNSFIHILTSGRFRSQKAFNDKILSHTSKTGKNDHIGLFTMIVFFANLLIIYSTLYNRCHECHNRSKQLLIEKTLVLLKVALVSF
jgi:hypothetical protein